MRETGGQTKISVRNAMELDAGEKQVNEFTRSYGSGTSVGARAKSS